MRRHLRPELSRPLGRRPLGAQDGIFLVEMLIASLLVLLVGYLGLAADGRSATFPVATAAASRGAGICVDGGSCRMIALKAGQSRAIRVHTATGSRRSYLLQVVSVSARTTSNAAAARAHSHVDGAGRAVLRTLIRDGRIAAVLGRYSFSQRLGMVLPVAAVAGARP